MHIGVKSDVNLDARKVNVILFIIIIKRCQRLGFELRNIVRYKHVVKIIFHNIVFSYEIHLQTFFPHN